MKTMMLSMTPEDAKKNGVKRTDKRLYDIVLSENGDIALPVELIPKNPTMTLMCLLADGEPLITNKKRSFARIEWIKNEIKDSTAEGIEKLHEYIKSTEESIKADWANKYEGNFK